MRAKNSSLAELLEGSKVLAVPLFQRRYSWGRPQWRALWTNLEEQYEYQAADANSGQPPMDHFIGSFVLSPVLADSTPPRILVVDGQQRLITVSALLAAIRDLRWNRASDASVRHWLEGDFTKAYLTNSLLAPTAENRFRVLPTQEDREDFFSTVGETPGRPTGAVGEAYRFFSKEARGRDFDGNPFDLERLTQTVLSRFNLVEIRTEQGDNVHRVFQTLNSSGVMLKQLDLLRNHFFMLLPTRADELYRSVWRDMELRLGESTLDKFFWASLVRYDTRVSRKTVFATMQARLARDRIESSEERVEKVLRRLNDDSVEYLKLVEPTEESRPLIRRRLEALERWGTDTYHPLGLRLLTASRDGELADDDLEVALLAIESFLVRRMLVGIPTNNLNRIFSAITGASAGRDVLAWLRESLSAAGRVWPDDATVHAAVRLRPFFFSGQPAQRVYVLQRLNEELSRSADQSSERGNALDLVRVASADDLEHWSLDELVTPDGVSIEPVQLLNSIGNAALVPKGQRLKAQEPLFARLEMLRSSQMPVNDDLANSEWTPRDILERSSRMAEAVLRIWPGPPLQVRPLRLPLISEDLALSIPVGAFTTVDDLAEYWSVPVATVLEQMTSWPVEALGRVRTNSEGETFAKILHDVEVSEPLLRRLSAGDLSRVAEEDDAQYLEQAAE